MRYHLLASFCTPALLAGLLVPVHGAATPLPAPAPVPVVQEQDGDNGRDPGARRVLAPEDYARFENLGATGFSPGAGWVSVVVSRFDDDGEVRLIPTGTGAAERVFAKATRAVFAEGDRWAAVVTGPGQAERQRMQASRTPVRNDLVLVDLAGGEAEDQLLEEIASFDFSPDGAWILLRRYPPTAANGEGARETRGVDVLVRELATGMVTNFGNVAEAAWADDGAVLAMVVDARGQAGNGVRIFEPASGRIRTLHAEEARFSGLTWREDSRDLALFRIDPDTVRGDTLFTVLAWEDATAEGAAPATIGGALAGAGDERELRVTDVRGLRWAEAGGRLFFALQERAPVEEDDAEEADEAPEGDDAPEGAARPRGGERPGGSARGSAPDSVPGVEIWHAHDVDPIPQQRLRANQERRRSALAAWSLGAGEPVPLGGDAPGETVNLLPGEARAVVLDDAPWGTDRMFGPIFRDVHLVDVATGARTPIRERVEFFQQGSPSGRHLLFWEADAFHVHDLETGETVNVTGGIDAVFTNEQVDVVVDQKPPYGVAGWTEGDAHLLLYDQFDVWRVAPDGSGAERLTDGSAEQLRHRLVRLDPDQDAWPAEGPWVVSLFGDRTKESGWGELRPGGVVERRILADRGLQRLARSDDGDRHLWVSQRYDDPPTLHLGDARLGSVRDLYQANAFVADEFLWGRAELLDFENAWGVPLQAVLHYPADFQPGRTYPMVVYHYERLSQGLHNWVNPSDRSAYNLTAMTQNGYFVLQPDIVYRPRDPGRSAMASFDPALDAALATGHIDPDRIGIMGHSWGGYQTTFAATQTDRFAAAVAGAPLTNLISMYLSFYWNSGSTDARIFEISQGRMEVPWWEDYEAYVANSPVHHIEQMNTPLLMAFGTEDGAVEFNQGVEFYNAARRLQKDFVLLVYEGENHGLAQRPNQMDYHRRTLEWFNHYLKGEPAPAWITEGVSYVEQQEKLRRGPAAGRVPAPGAGGDGGE
jgi:dipeptidyl aminopeptidase/acylaminoacyl peptidase